MNVKSIIARVSAGSVAINEILLALNRSPAIFGAGYRERFKGYWSTDGQSMLLEVVNRALAEVPYYRGLQVGAAIGSVREFKSRFPTIDKDIVLGNLGGFVSDGLDHSRYDHCTTGGTSGKPLQLLLPKDRYVHEYAALHRVWEQIGYRFSPRAVVRNQRLQGRDFIINPVLREYVFDGFRNDDDYFGKIYDVMKVRRIGFYHGYTSNAYEFARFMIRERLDYSFLKGIITSSENFYEHQRAVFDALDGVRHVNFYGHSEKLVLAAYCPKSSLYHFHSQYGFCELLGASGDDVAEVGELCEIVGSTIYNVGMPLLRYRTGDFATYAGTGRCAHCGHDGMSASQIHGRWLGDRIFNSDGSFVTSTALNLHSELYQHIEGLQYVQEVPGEVMVRVVPSASFNESVADMLRRDVASKLHSTTRVRIESVEELERKQNGKFMLLVSRCEQS